MMGSEIKRKGMWFPMSQVLEAMMLICFGISWPMNAYKAYKARTAAGSSLAFILLILFGYLCGITAKILTGNINYVLIVYFLNLITVCLNLAVYFRNKNLDHRREGTLTRRKTVAA